MRTTASRAARPSAAQGLWSRRVVLLFVFVACSSVGSCDKPSDWDPSRIRSLSYPAWGPQGWIVFHYPDSGLWRIKPDGSGLSELTPEFLINLSWSPNGEWIVGNDQSGRILRINRDGDSVALVTQTGAKWYPHYSPDERQLAFSTPDSDELGPRGLRILDLETREERPAFPYGLEPSWSPDGKRLVFIGWVYENGVWVGGAGGSLVLVDTSGANPQMIRDCPDGGGFESPSFSPDGTRVLFREPVYSKRPGQVWVTGGDGSNAEQLTKMGGRSPCWSPDGTRIVYVRFTWNSNPDGNGDLYVMDADGSHEQRLTFFDFNKQ